MKNKRQPKRLPVKATKKVASVKPTPKVKSTAKRSIRVTTVKPLVESTTGVKTRNKPAARCVPVLIRTKFYSKSLETAQTLQVPMIDKDTIRLDLTINLRMSEAILITPIRRDMGDVNGLISDAESIANEN